MSRDDVPRVPDDAPEPPGLDYPAAPTPGRYAPLPDAHTQAAPRSARRTSRVPDAEAQRPPAVESPWQGAPPHSAPRQATSYPPPPPVSPGAATHPGVRASFAPLVVAAIVLAGLTVVLTLLGRYALLAWLTGVPGFVVSLIAVVQGARPRAAAAAAMIATVVAGIVSVGVFAVSIRDDGGSSSVAQPSATPSYGTLAADGAIGDGVWRVGQDAEAGLYRVTAPVQPTRSYLGCSWTTYSSDNHDYANVIDYAYYTSGRPIVDLVGAVEFESSHCGQWEPVDPATLFDNPDAPLAIPTGVWLVGEDVGPGVYRTAESLTFAEDYEACDWAAFDGATQAYDSEIESGYVSGGRPTVVLGVGQTFRSSQCGDWVSVDPSSFFQRSDAPSSFTPGVWIVGEDFEAGTYSTVVPFAPQDEYDYCYWNLSASWEDSVWDGIDADYSDDEGTRTVTLTTGQRFESDGCGDWERVGP